MSPKPTPKTKPKPKIEENAECDTVNVNEADYVTAITLKNCLTMDSYKVRESIKEALKDIAFDLVIDGFYIELRKKQPKTPKED